MSETPRPTKLYQALLLALADMGPVLKTATNPGFRSKYADLPGVLDTITPPLHKHGLFVVQRLGVSLDNDDLPLLTTELIHAESGETIQSCARLASKDPSDPQKFGSALTYYRRYALLALLGIAPEDDDGNAASQPAQRPTPARASAPPASPAPRSAPAPLTEAEYTRLFEQAWTLVEDGRPYLDVVAFVKRSRDRMTEEQYAQSRDEVRTIRKAIDARDAETPRPASFAG